MLSTKYAKGLSAELLFFENDVDVLLLRSILERKYENNVNSQSKFRRVPTVEFTLGGHFKILV